MKHDHKINNEKETLTFLSLGVSPALLVSTSVRKYDKKRPFVFNSRYSRKNGPFLLLLEHWQKVNGATQALAYVLFK